MRLSAYDLTIFDCDGVLVDSEPISCAAVAAVLTRHGLARDVPYVMANYLGRSASAVTEDYVRITGRPLPAAFVADWRSILFAGLGASLEPIPGIRALLEALPMDYCVASSSDVERIEFSLRKAGLLDLFEDRIFSSSMVANGKPAPDLFLHAAARRGADPARCVVIEDSPSGVRAAKAAGMTAIGFTGGSHYAILDITDQLIEVGADHIVAAMPEMLSAVAGKAGADGGRRGHAS
jgi:HAD superfamily hydrolase (TIGR01509 family)